MNFIKKHPYFISLVLGTILIFVLRLPWYSIFIFYAVYGLIMYFTHFATCVGMTGYLIDAFLHKEKWAIPFYRYAANHGSKCVYGLLAYGLHLLRECHYPEALAIFERLVSFEKINPMMLKYARQDLAIAYWKMGDLTKAIDTMEQMLKDYEYFSIDFYTTIGYFYIEAGNYEKATEFSNKALDEDESHGPAYDNLGQIQYRLGNYEEAESLLLKALDLKETMADSKYYLGMIYESWGETESARNYFIAAHNSKVTGMNTITRETIEEKYREYENA